VSIRRSGDLHGLDDDLVHLPDSVQRAFPFLISTSRTSHRSYRVVQPSTTPPRWRQPSRQAQPTPVASQKHAAAPHRLHLMCVFGTHGWPAAHHATRSVARRRSDELKTASPSLSRLLFSAGGRSAGRMPLTLTRDSADVRASPRASRAPCTLWCERPNATAN
jgi:hypothetical protein